MNKSNRLIWLHDLGLLAKSGAYFFISQKGSRLLELLNNIDTPNGSYRDLNERWIANNTSCILLSFDHETNTVTTLAKKKVIGDHLTILFNYFGSDGSQRLSLFSSFLFSLIVFTVEHQQSITFDEWFSQLNQGVTVENKRYTVKLSPRFFESYINVSFE